MNRFYSNLTNLEVYVAGHSGQAISFSVTNKCPFPIWPATAPSAGHLVIADGGFLLPSGNTRRIEAPPTWKGRIWARTRCNFTSTSKPACQTGDCVGRLACKGSIGQLPATLVEVSLEPDKSIPSFYDVSLVDGYNLPVSISTKPIASNCSIRGCLKNLNSLCPQELQVKNGNGEVVACKSAGLAFDLDIFCCRNAYVVVACKSACLAFDLDIFCCRNAYGSPGKCKPSMYSKMFKNACPSYFSYAFDTPPPLVRCLSKEYV